MQSRLSHLVAALLRAQVDWLGWPALARREHMGALLDLLHGCGALMRWRCDARNAEQNIAGLGLP